MHRFDGRPSTASASRGGPGSAMRGGRPRAGDRDRLAPGPEIQRNFMFGRIPYADLLDDLSQIVRRRVTTEELKAPTPELVHEVMGAFIQQVLGKTTEQITQPAFGVLDQLDHPVLYDQTAIGQVMFHQYTNQLLEMSGFGPFGIRDFFVPDKVRFHYQISALINFARFRAQRLTPFEELKEKGEGEIAQQRKLEDEKAKLEGELKASEEELERERPEMEKLKEQITEAGAKLSAQHKQQRELAEKSDGRKAVLKKLLEDEEKVRAAVKAERAEVERLRAKVVSSPGRVRAVLDGMEGKVEALREHKGSVVTRTKMLEAREEGLNKVSVQCEKLEHLNSDTVEKVKGLHHVHENIQRLKGKKADVDTQNDAAEESKQRIRREIASHEARIARIVEQKQGIENRSTSDERERMERVTAMRERMDELKKARARKEEEVQQVQVDILRELRRQDEQVARVELQANKMVESRRAFDVDVAKTVDVYAAMDKEGQEKFTELIAQGARR